ETDQEGDQRGDRQCRGAAFEDDLHQVRAAEPGAADKEPAEDPNRLAEELQHLAELLPDVLGLGADQGQEVDAFLAAPSALPLRDCEGEIEQAAHTFRQRLGLEIYAAAAAKILQADQEGQEAAVPAADLGPVDRETANRAGGFEIAADFVGGRQSAF